MTKEQRDILDEKFIRYEKYSTWFVLFVFTIIVIIQVINPVGSWKIDLIKYMFRVCLGLVFAFVGFSFLKELFFPLIAKFYFKD